MHQPGTSLDCSILLTRSTRLAPNDEEDESCRVSRGLRTGADFALSSVDKISKSDFKFLSNTRIRGQEGNNKILPTHIARIH